MKRYEVTCWKRKKSTVQVGDTVNIKGKTSALGDGTIIKADKIENQTQNGPICVCGEPELPTSKLFTKDVEKTGKVTYVEEREEGFLFHMEAKQ